MELSYPWAKHSRGSSDIVVYYFRNNGILSTRLADFGDAIAISTGRGMKFLNNATATTITLSAF